MDRISRHCQRLVEVWFVVHRVTSLLFAYDIALLASLHFQAAGMRVRLLGHVPQPEKGSFSSLRQDNHLDYCPLVLALDEWKKVDECIFPENKMNSLRKQS